MSFSLGLIDWAICLVVLSSSILFQLYLAVRKKSSPDGTRFFLAGRSLSWPSVGGSLFATNIGAEHLVGLSGDAYRYGVGAGTVELTTAWCLGFAAVFRFPFHIPNRVFTTPEFLETRYHPRGVRDFFRADGGHFHHHQDGISPFCPSVGFAWADGLERNESGLDHRNGNRGRNHHWRLW